MKLFFICVFLTLELIPIFYSKLFASIFSNQQNIHSNICQSKQVCQEILSLDPENKIKYFCTVSNSKEKEQGWIESIILDLLESEHYSSLIDSDNSNTNFMPFDERGLYKSIHESLIALEWSKLSKKSRLKISNKSNDDSLLSFSINAPLQKNHFSFGIFSKEKKMEHILGLKNHRNLLDKIQISESLLLYALIKQKQKWPHDTIVARSLAHLCLKQDKINNFISEKSENDATFLVQQYSTYTTQLSAMNTNESMSLIQNHLTIKYPKSIFDTRVENFLNHILEMDQVNKAINSIDKIDHNFSHINNFWNAHLLFIKSIPKNRRDAQIKVVKDLLEKNKVKIEEKLEFLNSQLPEFISTQNDIINDFEKLMAANSSILTHNYIRTELKNNNVLLGGDLNIQLWEDTSINALFAKVWQADQWLRRVRSLIRDTDLDELKCRYLQIIDLERSRFDLSIKDSMCEEGKNHALIRTKVNYFLLESFGFEFSNKHDFHYKSKLKAHHNKLLTIKMLAEKGERAFLDQDKNIFYKAWLFAQTIQAILDRHPAPATKDILFTLIDLEEIYELRKELILSQTDKLKDNKSKMDHLDEITLWVAEVEEIFSKLEQQIIEYSMKKIKPWILKKKTDIINSKLNGEIVKNMLLAQLSAEIKAILENPFNVDELFKKTFRP